MRAKEFLEFLEICQYLGKIFVKGHYSNPSCRVDYSKTISDSNPVGGIILSHGQCDMNRQRMLFITKLDRAFHVKCLYREVVRIVSSGIEVSTMAAQTLEYEYPFPNCIYTIRRDEIDGPILKYAKVGDQIVHRWECLSDAYGLLVHNCYVEDGQGEKQIIIDEQGCHTDRTLLGDPTYVESLNMAYRESLVFKFADRVIVRFQCQIRLCVKEGGGCIGVTPPMCLDEKQNQKISELFITTSGPAIHYTLEVNNTEIQLKRRRLIRSSVSERSKLTIDADLISQPVYVLDADDDDAGDNSDRIWRNTPELCVSNALFIILVSVIIVALLALTASTIWLMHRWLRPSGGVVNEYYKKRYASHINALSF
uniref:ZP domain-containing protein n=1 Tax=Setaria digitata TaxID=48799 RepID=A0A915Q407_9BILA